MPARKATCVDRDRTQPAADWEKAVKGKVPPPPTEPDWVRLLDAERALEAQMAAAEADARTRVAEARAGAASAAPDPAATAALAAAEEQADIERHESELARIGEEADAALRALAQVPDSLIDALADLALGGVFADEYPVARR